MRKIYQPNFILSLAIFALLLFGGTSSAQPFNFDGLTAGATGNFANGWVGTPTTGFSWRADNNGTGSSGTGPAVDHTLGTAAGIYMYTEASSPAAPGDSAILESPNISLASFSAPALTFWYHKFGSTMGDLFVDVFNGTTWVRDVDSVIGQTQFSDTDPWLEKVVNLTAFSGTIKVRFRAYCGSSFSGDMAVDDVNIVELPAFDLELTNARISAPAYTQYPLSQAINISFAGTLGNLGAQTLTNPTMKVTVGSWVDSASVASLASGATAGVTTALMPVQPVGAYDAIFSGFADQADSNQTNNLDTVRFAISDSIYSRDDSVATGSLGIGAGTAGILGQIFDIYVADTLTSVSFFLTNPAQGDTTFVTLHSFSGTPGAEIARTDTLFVPTAGPGWYTLSFPCPQVLTPGTYFLGLHELFPNVTLGTTGFNFQPNTTWVIFGGNPWNPSEFYGFPITYLLRANFGEVSVSLNAGVAGTDSTCANAGMVDLNTLITGNDPGGVWNDDNSTGALSGTMVDPSITGPGTFNFSYIVSDSCGISASATATIVVAAPGNAGNDSTLMVCDFDGSFDLTPFLGTADPGGSWSDDNSSGALTGSNFDPSAAGPGSFNFTYTVLAPGCGPESATITVDVVICPAIDPSVPLSFSVYPNPNQGRFRLDAPGSLGQDLQIRVTDLTGREIYSKSVYNGTGTMEVDLGAAASGMYIVELSNGEAKTTGRLVKE